MMKRPLLIVTIGYMLGIIIGMYFKQGIFLFFFGSLWIGKICKKEKQGILLALAFLIAFGKIGIQEREFNNFQTKYNNQEIEVTGILIQSFVEKEYSYMGMLKIEEINGTKFPSYQLKIQIKKDKKKKEVYQLGDKIVGKVIIHSAEKTRNTGGFNETLYNKTKRIMATGKTTFQQIKKKGRSNNPVYKVKEKIENNCRNLLEKTKAELCLGILLGEKTSLEKEIIDDFKKSNLSHLLAVSGAHISYVILAITSIIEKSKIGKRKGYGITVIALIFFMNLTGNTPSVVRACSMSILVFISYLCYRKTDRITTISFSILFILINNPYAIADIGMQLSYAGTIGIIGIYPILFKKKQLKEEKQSCFSKIRRYMQETIKISIAANILIFPLMIYHFNTISLIFLLSNCLASPILGIVILLGFGMNIVTIFSQGIAKCIAFFLQYILLLFLQIVQICGSIPFGTILIVTPSILFILFLYIVIFLSIYLYQYPEKRKLFKRKIRKYIAVILILSILISFISHHNPNLSIYFIDVGQGDATLVVTNTNKTILIDGGGSKEKETYDIGEKVLLPYLLDRKITSIDYMMISHFDEDHCQGLLTVMKELKVNNVIIGKQFEDYENYMELKKIAKEKKIKVQIVEAGQKIRIENGLHFDVLWPDSKNIISENSINNNSLVCKMVYQNFSCVFTGDIEEIAEKAILKKYKDRNVLQSTILKVAHHGSKSSSTEEFLDTVKPKIALIGVGENNTFGHPNSGVLERIEGYGSKIFRTDLNGEIMIKVNRKGRIWIDKMLN